MLIGWIALGAAAVIAVAVVLALASSAEFRVLLNRTGANDRILIDVKALYGLVRVHYVVPSIVFSGLKQGLKVRLERTGMDALLKQEDEKKTVDKEAVDRFLQTFRQALQGTEGLREWTAQMLARVRITQLDWSTDFSLGDAAGTATAAGALWGCKWIVVGWLSQRVRLLRSPRLFVKPVFSDNLSFVTQLEGKGRIRVAGMLTAGWQLIRRVRAAEGGPGIWKELLRGLRGGSEEKEKAA